MTTSPTFGEWLTTAKITDDPVGDLMQDWRDDRRRPQEVRTLDELIAYLRSRRAEYAVVEAAREAWERFESR